MDTIAQAMGSMGGGTNLGTLRVNLDANSATLDKNLKKAEGSLQSWASKADKALKPMTPAINAIGAALTGIGVAATSIAVGSIATFASFEQTMKDVASVSQATEQEYKQLSGFAKEMGETTVFSAREAGQAMYYLASAGMSVKEQMSSTNVILDLAAATQSGLAEATKLTVASMNAYHIPAAEAGRITNVFAATISSSQATLEKLAVSMPYVGATFNSLGYTVEETSAALGILYDSGLEASMAGTRLGGAITTLLKPTAQVNKGLAALGLTIDDVNPSTNSLVDIVGKFEEAGLDAASAAQIFGRRSEGMTLLVSAGADALRGMQANITGTDRAAEMAAEQLNSLSGDLKLLKSAVEGAAISMGEQLAPVIRDMIEKTAELVGKFNALPDSSKKMAAWGTAIAGALGLIGGPLLLLVPRLPAMASGFALLGGALLAIVASPITVGLGVVAGGITAIASGLMLYKDARKDVFIDKEMETVANDAKGVQTAIDDYARAIKELEKYMAQGYDQVSLWGVGIKSLGSGVKPIPAHIKNLQDKIADLQGELRHTKGDLYDFTEGMGKQNESSEKAEGIVSALVNPFKSLGGVVREYKSDWDDYVTSQEKLVKMREELYESSKKAASFLEQPDRPTSALEFYTKENADLRANMKLHRDRWDVLDKDTILAGAHAAAVMKYGSQMWATLDDIFTSEKTERANREKQLEAGMKAEKDRIIAFNEMNERDYQQQQEWRNQEIQAIETFDQVKYETLMKGMLAEKLVGSESNESKRESANDFFDSMIAQYQKFGLDTIALEEWRHQTIGELSEASEKKQAGELRMLSQFRIQEINSYDARLESLNAYYQKMKLLYTKHGYDLVELEKWRLDTENKLNKDYQEINLNSNASYMKLLETYRDVQAGLYGGNQSYLLNQGVGGSDDLYYTHNPNIDYSSDEETAVDAQGNTKRALRDISKLGKSFAEVAKEAGITETALGRTSKQTDIMQVAAYELSDELAGHSLTTSLEAVVGSLADFGGGAFQYVTDMIRMTDESQKFEAETEALKEAHWKKMAEAIMKYGNDGAMSLESTYAKLLQMQRNYQEEAAVLQEASGAYGASSRISGLGSYIQDQPKTQADAAALEERQRASAAALAEKQREATAWKSQAHELYGELQGLVEQYAEYKTDELRRMHYENIRAQVWAAQSEVNDLNNELRELDALRKEATGEDQLAYKEAHEDKAEQAVAAYKEMLKIRTMFDAMIPQQSPEEMQAFGISDTTITSMQEQLSGLLSSDIPEGMSVVYGQMKDMQSILYDMIPPDPFGSLPDDMRAVAIRGAGMVQSLDIVAKAADIMTKSTFDLSDELAGHSLTTSLEAAAESSSVFSAAVAQNIADLTGLTSASADQSSALYTIEKQYTDDISQVYLDYAAGKIVSQSAAYQKMLELQNEYQKQSKAAQLQYQAELNEMSPEYMKMQRLQNYVTRGSDSDADNYRTALQSISESDNPDDVKATMIGNLTKQYERDIQRYTSSDMPTDIQFGKQGTNNSFSITINAGASLVDRASLREFTEMIAVEMQKAGAINQIS